MSLHTLNPRTEAETALAGQFAALGAGGARAAAFGAFAAQGLPTRRQEAWHYTDLRAALKSAASLAPAPDAARGAAAATQLAAIPRCLAARLVLVDGHYAPSLSDAPAGVTIAMAEAAAEDAGAVVSLNEAFVGSALRIDVVGATAALEIVHLDGPGAIYSRIAVSVPAKATLTVFERFEGATRETQRNAVATLDLAEGARCDWTALVGDHAAIHLEAPIARLAAGAEFNDFGLVCGGALVRRQIEVSHHAPGAKIGLFGLSLLDGKRHADTTLTVRHAAPNGVSREYFRHIVADEAVGVYQGKVVVEPQAQKTDGGMKSQALLLSPNAQMNNKPELEIFADDVVCGHGATVGALDPEQIFYLRARGIPHRQAEAMLLEAFGVEAIERVAEPQVAEALRERLQAWLKGRAA